MATLFKLERAGICALNHLEATQNANGRILVWLVCPKCSDESDCIAVARLIEERINLRNSVATHTLRVQMENPGPWGSG